MSNEAESSVNLDLSDVDPRVGQFVGGGQLWDPCSSSDIRRWVMAMDYPNPIHWDEEFARQSKFKGLVAPQSIAVRRRSPTSSAKAAGGVPHASVKVKLMNQDGGVLVEATAEVELPVG